METSPTPVSQPPQFSSAPPAKKGLSTGAKVGIGCGGLVLLALIGLVIAAFVLGPKLAKMGENPTRATASVMVMAGGEMVAEDDVAKRYTVKDKKSGVLTTIYWDEASQAPKVVEGDFSAIPSDLPAEVTPAEDPTAADESAPDPDQP
jgi:hypothetical protein